MKQIVSILIIISVVYSAGFGVFIKKVEATTTWASVAGSAVGAGAACWAEKKLGEYLKGWATKTLSTSETESRPNLLTEKVVYDAASESTAKTGDTAWGTELATNVPALQTSLYWYAQSAFYDAQSQKVLAKEVVRAIDDLKQQTQSSAATEHESNCMRDVVVKKILDWTVDQVVDWIQNGGDLSDRFVTDWSSYADDAFNTAAGAVIQEALPLVCSSFSAQFELTLGNPVEKFGTQIGCTLDDVVENIDNFYDDFTSADDPWLAYNTMWQPQNNFFGATIMTKDKALNEGVKNQASKLNDALASKGFISSKQCKTTATYANYEDINGSNCSGDELNSSGTCKEAYVKDLNGKYCKGKDMEIVTPGANIANLIDKQINIDIDWIVNSRSYITAIANAVINRAMKEGVAYMTRTDGTTSSYDPEVDTSDEYDPSAEETTTLTDYYSTVTLSGPILINNGDSSTDSLNVSLTIDASAAGMSDAVYMKVSEKSDFSDVIYGPYATSAVATLSSGAGTKTLYIKFKDADGNETSATNADSIEYGTASTAITINSGDEKTIYVSTTLTIDASAGGMSDVSKMMVSENSAFTNSAKGDTTWQSYFSSKSWDIKSCDLSNNTATVYVKFQNNSGDVVGDDGSLSDSITLSDEAEKTLCVATP